ncbi:conserved hypothetical protein, partial [Ixodes scapularis]
LPAALGCVTVEPVGRWFESVYCNPRARHASSAASVGSQSSDEDEQDGGASESPADTRYLLSLDPKEWRQQDHYRVLGLQAKRHRATEHDLKKAYRRKVLLHHPDKRRTAGEQVRDMDHDYFSCITRAYEILGNPVRRRSYDSVDPEFDDDVPSGVDARLGFFATFGPVNCFRWSTKRDVPSLGHEDSTRDEVDRFYHFWYSFDSWREYSYLDEEEKEKGENREERRWIEKQNRAARQKRKREEMQRIRQLVDTAYACDPRVQRFKEEERERKLAHKRAKQEASRAKALQEEKERQEQEDAQRLERERQEEDARLQVTCLRNPSSDKQCLDLDPRLVWRYFYSLQSANKHGAATALLVAWPCSGSALRASDLYWLGPVSNLVTASFYIEYVYMLTFAKNYSARLPRLTVTCRLRLLSGAWGGGGGSSSPFKFAHAPMEPRFYGRCNDGTDEHCPWEVVAAFLNQHSSVAERTARDVLAKAKSLQRLDPQLKEEANRKAYEQHERTVGKGEVSFKDESVPSQRFDGPEAGSTWTAEEQRLLEQALKTFPSSTADRWDRIAECVPNRSKKDCMRRYKDLVELVRSKKAAQQAAAAQASRTGKP